MQKSIYKTIYNALKQSLCLVAMLLLTSSALAQVGGTVIDDTGAPVIGASVIVKGTTVGVSTDIKGAFSIPAKTGQTLTISFIGYKPQEIKINNQSQLNIKLESDNNVLDEVVVVGYGSSKRSDLTGSIATVSGKDVAGFKSSSVVEALGGQVAGVQITSADGAPGAGFDVKIRGIGTLNGDAGPLYIVDGFQMDNIDYLANSDIESIDVLKDASASAIYGSRAANGVVLVTTKQGKVGTATVTYNGSASYRQIAKYIEMMTPYDFVKLQVELDPGSSGTYYKEGSENGVPNRYQSLDNYIGVDGVDWQRETFRPTWSQDHNVALSGGNQNTKYNMSFSNFSENGIFTNSSFDKTTAKLRLNQKVTKGITVDATVNYSNTMTKGTGTSGDGGRFNMLAQIFSARPTGGLKMTDDELLNAEIDPLELEEGGSSLAQVNPIKQAQSVTDDKRKEMWQGNVSVNIELYKDLFFKSSGSYVTTNQRQDKFYQNGSKEAYRNGRTPYGQTTMLKDVRWSNSNVLSYKFKVSNDHNFDAMLGQEMTYNSSEFLRGQSKGFPFDYLGNNNLGLGATPSLVDTDFGEKMLISFFGRVFYNYKDRYMLTATLRSDGSSVFSDSHKWGVFPAASAAWRISEEKFLKSSNVISNLKLRVGWGTVGNDRIPSFLSMWLYEASKYGIGNSLTTTFDTKHLRNPNIRWEGSTTTNVGVDIGLLKNRLNITADVFLKDTKDLLIEKELAYVTGMQKQWQNIGKIRNKGLELSINSVNFQTPGGFMWRTDFNISFIRNSLVGLQPGEKQILTRTGFDSNYADYDYVARVGESLGLMYGYIFDGIYQSSDFNSSVGSGKVTVKDGIVDMNDYYDGSMAAGMVKYKDIDGDGKITTADRTVMGNGVPDFYGGITNSFSYKGFDLNFMLQFNYGNDVYNATRMYSTQSKLKRTNKMAEVANRWTPTNANNEVPSANGYKTNAIYSRFIEDGSFLRLKNLTLGYTLPQNITRKFYVKNLRVYLSAQNLFVITGYEGYDPEVSMRAQNPMTPSFDWGAYPKSKIYTFGLDLTF